MEYIGNTRTYIDKFNYLKYNNKYNLKYPFIKNDCLSYNLPIDFEV